MTFKDTNLGFCGVNNRLAPGNPSSKLSQNRSESGREGTCTLGYAPKTCRSLLQSGDVSNRV